MSDLDPAGVFAIDAAERIVAAEAMRPLPPPDDEAEVIVHWYPWPSGNIHCDRCERLAESCACWAEMMARRAAAEDADDMRGEADRG